METEKLIMELKKYKKWNETFLLNPFAYEVNGHKFYTVSYRKNNKETGYAIISLDSAVKKEYLEALPVLVIFSGVGANIFNIIGERATVDTHFFDNIIEPTKAYILESDSRGSAVLKKGIGIFESLRNYHNELLQLYREYESYYDKKY